MLGTYIETLQALYTRTTFFYVLYANILCSMYTYRRFVYKNIFLTRNDRIQR